MLKKWFDANGRVILNSEGRVKLCEYCPCPPPSSPCVYPEVYIVYDCCQMNGGDPCVGPATANYIGSYVTGGICIKGDGDCSYDPALDLWESLPFDKCVEGGTNYTYYCMGIPDTWTGVATEREGFYYRAACDISGYHCPPPVYYFFKFQTSASDVTIDGDPGHYVTWVITPGQNFDTIHSGEEYSFETYDHGKSGEVPDPIKICEGKITINFSGEIAIPIEGSPGEFLDGYFFDGYTTQEGQTKTIGISVNDTTNNIQFNTSNTYDILQVFVSPCRTSKQYAIVGQCKFTAEGCAGCLISTTLYVWEQTAAEAISGKCITRADSSAKSTMFSILEGNFESYSDALDYRTANYATLISDLKDQCVSESKWIIQGSCTCNYEESQGGDCTECVYAHVSIICEDEFESCVIDDTHMTATQYHKLAGGKTFDTEGDATVYYVDNFDDLLDELKELCPPATVCIYQWKSEYSASTGWSDPTQLYMLCDSPDDYTEGWEIDPDNPCVDIYTSISSTECTSTDDCDWPDPPDKPTGIPADCPCGVPATGEYYVVRRSYWNQNEGEGCTGTFLGYIYYSSIGPINTDCRTHGGHCSERDAIYSGPFTSAYADCLIKNPTDGLCKSGGAGLCPGSWQDGAGNWVCVGCCS